MWILVGPRKHVLDAGAHWHCLSNMIEPSMCGSDVALLLNTLTTCYNCCGTLHCTSCIQLLWLLISVMWYKHVVHVIC